MVEIRTILCPVDLSATTERQVFVAADLCRAWNARLVLHYNLRAVGVGAAVGWMYSETHPGPPTEEQAAERLKQLLSSCAAGLPSEAKLTRGTPTATVLRVAEHVKADLVVLTAHEGSHDEHMSMSEQILDQARCGVLALHEPDVDREFPRFASATPEGSPQRVLVPTSFSPTSADAVEFAMELARRLPIELHLLHIEQARESRDEPASPRADADRRRLKELLPADVAERAQVHVAEGDPVQEIPAAAERLGASLIVMGEHSRTSLLRWFRRDTGRSILHHAHCPVWYVP